MSSPERNNPVDSDDFYDAPDRRNYDRGPAVTYVEKFLITPNRPVTFSLDVPMADGNTIKAQAGYDADLVCAFRIGNDDFSIHNLQHSRDLNFGSDTPLLIVDDRFSRQSRESSYKGLRSGEPVTLGRNYNEDRFDYSETVSREHCRITYNALQNTVSITDLESRNGTKVTGYALSPTVAKQSPVRSDYTRNFEDHVKKSPDNSYGEKTIDAPYGYFRNHPIIGRNSKTVRDGVFGTHSSECVVVNHNSRSLATVTDKFFYSLIRKNHGRQSYNHLSLISHINDYTAKVLLYDKPKVDRLSRPHYNNNGLINLSDYVDAGVGVCRHQALLCAHLIESAIDRGMLTGSVGVERNRDIELKSGHAWALFRPVDGPVIIADPAQHFVGTRDQADSQNLWKYHLGGVDDNQSLN